jgi:predicted unusual protein kinase regulating ubiquinone biosynthesis (AarF/ABC1/UbiB family)
VSRRAVPPEPEDVSGLLLGRAAQIGRVLGRYGLGELRSDAPDDYAGRRARAERLRAALEELGPTFAKLGQILSTRPDLLPPEFAEELATLQDRVTPLTEAEVVAAMELELGVPWEDVFDSIEPVPMAAGTIGQVHRATLEGGTRVVVKVQRPGAALDIYRDLGLLELFADRTAGKAVFQQLVDLPAVIEHLSTSLRRELDFRLEAANIEHMREVIAPYPRLAVPAVFKELSTPRLLVMEEIQGTPIREAPEGEDRREAARQLLDSYYRQILSEGFFHADPHPGNLKWWNGRIYFLDFGMVGEVDQDTREHLLLMLMAFGQGDAPFLTDVMLSLAGEDQRSDVDYRAVRVELGELVDGLRGVSLKDIQLGPILQGLTEIAARNGVRLPSALALTGKALAQMQLATAELDPTLDPFAVAGDYLFRDLRGRVREGADIQRLVYEGQKLKRRLTRLAEAVERLAGARPGPRLQVQFTGIEHLESTIHKAARRVALAITAGACIVGTGFTANAERVDAWVPVTLGAVGAALTAGLLVDLFFRRD